jgi:hypothetical protein
MDSHRTDPFSFITGVLFLVIGLMALVGDVALDDVGGDWLGPVLLGAAGLALLASVPLRRGHPEAPNADVDSFPNAAAAADDPPHDVPDEQQG